MHGGLGQIACPSVLNLLRARISGILISGELGKAGENFKVADKESQRPGFKLCRHCGKVQLPPRR